MSKPFSTSNSIIGNFYKQSQLKLPQGYSSYSSAKSQLPSFQYSNTLSKYPDQPKGLQNLTNTCYISAILQVLFPIINQTDFPNPNKSKQEITYHFFKLKDSKSRSDYKYFKQALEDRIEIVRGWDQQDAHQFLVHLLEQLRKQNPLPLKSTGIVNFKYKQSQNFQQNWQHFKNLMLKLQNSKIINLFSGEILKRLTCEEGHLKHNFERFNNISLSFSQKNTSVYYQETTVKLVKIVQDYFKPQDIQGILCQTCKAKKVFKKESAIFSGPKYLILHLSRFIKGYYENQKNKTEVQFDSTLSMHSFRQKDLRYKLIGIVHHEGSLNRGHYYADVLLSGEWFQMNDQRVYKQRINEKSNISSTVYLLIYQKFA